MDLSNFDVSIPQELLDVIATLKNSDRRHLNEVFSEKEQMYQEDPNDLGRIGGYAPWCFIRCLDTLKKRRIDTDLVHCLAEVTRMFKLLTSHYPKVKQYRLFFENSEQLLQKSQEYLEQEAEKQRIRNKKEAESKAVEAKKLKEQIKEQHATSGDPASSHPSPLSPGKQSRKHMEKSPAPIRSNGSNPPSAAPTVSLRYYIYGILILLGIAVLGGYMLGRSGKGTHDDLPAQPTASSIKQSIPEGDDHLPPSPTQHPTVPAYDPTRPPLRPTARPTRPSNTPSPEPTQSLYGNLVVNVTDRYGNSLFATVQLDMRFETGKQVRFNKLLSTSNHTLIVKADGYMTRKRNVPIEGGNTTVLNIKLYRE